MKQLPLSSILVLSLFAFHLADAQITLISESCLTQNEADDRYASYSPNGDKIAFESNRDGTWQIYIMDANGENQLRLTHDNSNNRRPSWHPKGKKVLFESDRSGKKELYTIKLKNGKVKKLSNFKDGEEPNFACYSPNGKLIALSIAVSDSKSDIVLMKKNGKIVRRLTNNEFRNHYPRWSNQGNEIVYFSRKETNNQDDEIYKLNVKTGKEVRLTNWPKHNFCPAWSNDDQHIVYVTSMEDLRPEIYIMDANGENKVRITENEDGDTLPSWSPKSNDVLISGYREGNYEICKLKLDIE